MSCNITPGITACETTSFSIETITSPVVTTVESTFTTTKQFVTTCHASPGETVTIVPPLPSSYVSPSQSAENIPVSSSYTSEGIPSWTTPVQTYTPSQALTTAWPTVTIAEIVVEMQGANDDVYATSTLTFTISDTTQGSQGTATPMTVVVGKEEGDGWSTWSASRKGGMIAGCAIAGIFLILLTLFCCCRRKQTWIAHDWSVNSHPGIVPGHPHYGNGIRYRFMRGGAM